MDSAITLLDSYGVMLVFFVILLKEAGVPLPVPGDLLIIVAGARAATGALPIWGVLLAAIVAGVLGAYVQYRLARGPGRGLIYRFGRYIGLTPMRLDKASDTLKGRGWRTIAVGRAVPGLRMGTVAASGLAGVPDLTFIPGLIAGTIVFVAFHGLLGYAVGPSVTSIMDNINIPLWILLLALAILGLLGWFWIKARARRARAIGIGEPLLEWTDACCPVCLAAGRLTEREEKVGVVAGRET
jgi:membrane protein DedA with SNARE-associated domain